MRADNELTTISDAFAAIDFVVGLEIKAMK